MRPRARSVAAILALAILALRVAPPVASDEAAASAAKIKKALDLSKKIDSSLKPKAGAKEAAAAPDASDAEFLRRVTLDLAARTPTLAETRTFLAEHSSTKRQEAIERLLASDEFADLWSRRWCEVLFGNYENLNANVGGKNVNGKALRGAFREFREWLKEKIAADTSWQAIISELIQATGKLTENPLVLYKTSFYREGPQHLNFADSMSQSLLGVRISCARCHDHPFDRWTQEDYYKLAAFFIRLEARPAGEFRKDDCDDVVFSEKDSGDLMMPDSAKVVRAQFLGGPQVGTNEPRLPQLARFMTRDYAQVPRNIANRTWAYLMGRGFVEPVDDFNAKNKPLRGELLEKITIDFAASGCSTRFLFRAICNSEAYQRSSGGGGSAPFASAAVRQMTGEQLFKSIAVATSGAEKPLDFTSDPMRERWGAFREQLGPVFGADGTWVPTTVLPGNTRLSLLMRNSAIVQGFVQWEEGLIGKVERSGKPPAERIDSIFLSVLSRPPTDPERARYTAYAQAMQGDRAAYEDVIWTLLNSSEFMTRH